jgi:hypothetical protein
MVQILVDDTELSLEAATLGTVGELIEYVKSSIDPDAIILSLTRDEEPLSEADWKCPLSSLAQSQVRITTGSRTTFYQDRLQLTGAIGETLSETFGEIAKLFKTGMQNNAHEAFATTLDDLNAFVGWFYSILSMDEHLFEVEFREFTQMVEEFRGTCLLLQQHQLKQSWWSIGDIIELQVVPLIGRCKDLGGSALAKVLS